MGLLLLALILLLLLGRMPQWPHARGWGWGYRPSGLLGLLLMVVLVMILLDVIRWI
jgi:hypothetical protein